MFLTFLGSFGLIVELDLDEFPSECQIVEASTHSMSKKASFCSFCETKDPKAV